MFWVVITDIDYHVTRHQVDTVVEIGRVPTHGDIPRIVLNDSAVSRVHVRIEELPGGKIRVTDLNARNPIMIEGETLESGGMRELTLPVQFEIGCTYVTVESDSAAAPCPSPGSPAQSDSSNDLPNELRYRASQGRAQAADKNSDPVDATVFAPPAIPIGRMAMIQVFAHTPEQTETAQQLAQEFDDEAERRGFRSLELEILRGSSLTFHLKLPGLIVDEPVQSLVWRGEPSAVQFAVEVSIGQMPGTVIGTVTVSQQGVPLGHVKFKLAIVDRDEKRVSKPLGETACRYSQAFVSYASPDRTEVLKRVQMLARLKISYFQDVMDLEPGERWAKALYRRIDDCDLFLLFWSTAAKQSQWVQEEVRYALNRKGDNEYALPEIIPVPIEGPPLVDPPAELAHLHFNDYLLYFMK